MAEERFKGSYSRGPDMGTLKITGKRKEAGDV
jgi:hypothetical protein